MTWCWLVVLLVIILLLYQNGDDVSPSANATTTSAGRLAYWARHCPTAEFGPLVMSSPRRPVPPAAAKNLRPPGQRPTPFDPIDAVYTWVNGSDPLWLGMSSDSTAARIFGFIVHLYSLIHSPLYGSQHDAPSRRKGGGAFAQV